MSSPSLESMSPEEQAMFAAMVERLRQLRRKCGVPDAVSLKEAVAMHMISAEELARARWGELLPVGSEDV